MAWRVPVAAPPVVKENATLAQAGAPATAAEEPAQRTAAVSSERADEAELPVFPADRPPGRLEGIVLDLAHARVAGATVELKPWIGVMPAERRIRDDRTRDFTVRSEAGGTFTFADVPEGPYMLTASANGLSKRELVAVGPSALGPTVVFLETPATYGDDVRVHVRDVDGAPVANAAVALHGISAREGPIGFAGTEPLRGHTDAEGIWRVRGRSMRSLIAVANTADGRTGMARTERWVDPTMLRVTVAAPGRVHGRLVGVAEDELQGATLHAHVGGAEGPIVSAAIDGGSFSFDALPAGEHGLALQGSRGVRLVADASQRNPRHPLEGPTVTVRAGGTHRIQLSVDRGAGVRGAVTNGAVPVRGARVCVRPAGQDEQRIGAVIARVMEAWSPWADFRFPPSCVVRTATDDRGHYVVEGLSCGPHVVEVVASGLAVDRRVPVELKQGVVLDLTHDLEPAGALQVAGCKGKLAITPVRTTKPLLVTGAWDCVTVPGLPAGRYTLLREGPGGASGVEGFRPLCEFTIEAGRTTWLDLGALAYQASIRGIVRAGSRVLAGVAVAKGDARCLTDADGNYVLRRHDAWGIWGGMSAPLTVYEGGLQHSVRLPHDQYTNNAASLDIRLGEHDLAVEVNDQRGQPCAAELRLDLHSPAEVGGVESVYGILRVGAGDQPRFTMLPPGKLWIAATFASGVVERVQVEVPASGPLRLQDRPCGTVRVLASVSGVPPADGGVHAATWRGPGAAPTDDAPFLRNAWIRDDAPWDLDGVAVVRGVVAGEVRLLVTSGKSHKTLRFTLAPGETKDIEVDLPR